MAEVLIYALILLLALSIVMLFLLNIRLAILLIFLVGVSLQYLYKIEIGPINAFELAGIGIPCLLIFGLLTDGKSLLYELNKERIYQYNLLLIILLLLTGVIFSGILYPSHTDLSFIERLTQWFKLATSFIILLVVSAVLTDESKTNKLMYCILLSLLVPASIFIWQVATGSAIFNPRSGYSFASAYFHHPGVIAYYLLFCFPAAMIKFSESRLNKEKIFWSLILILLIALIYLTYRRGVWIGLIVQLVVYFFLLNNLNGKIKIAYFLIMLVLSFSLLHIKFDLADRLSAIATFFQHLPEAIETDQYDHLFSGRWGFFKANALYLSSQPILNFFIGNGIGSTYYASRVMGYEGGGHNIYLILFIEYGFLGFLAYMLFFYFLFLRLLRSRPLPNQSSRYNLKKALIAFLACYLIIGLATHVMYRLNANWILWGFFGAFLGMEQLGKPASVQENTNERWH